MSLSSMIEKCMSLVTGKGSGSEQTDESTQQEQPWEEQDQEPIIQPPSDM